MQLAMIQDELMPMDAVSPVYQDRALYFGDGVYEVIRSYQGRIFALDDHLARFANSLEAVDIHGITLETIKARVLKAFEQADIADAKIYFHVTRGSGPRDQVESPGMQPNFYLTITKLEDATQDKLKGIDVMSCPDLRWKRCDIKSLNLLPNILAKREAARQSCAEAILVDDRGLITEGSASAFFAVCKHDADRGRWPGLCLRTTALDKNILPSVTRKYVLKAAEAIELCVVEQGVRVEDAKAAPELFMAVTTRDIVPIVKFDGQVIGEGTPGNATRALMAAFKTLIARAKTDC